MDLKKHLQDQAAVATEAVSQYDADMAAQKLAGIEEGRAQIQLPEQGTGEVLYTQDQMSQAVNDAVANAIQPKDAHIEQLTKDLEAKTTEATVLSEELALVKTQLQAATQDVELVKEQAREELKAQLLADYDAKQVAETQGETDYRNALLPK